MTHSNTSHNDESASLLSRDNCFDLLRTLAAFAVLFSHSFALSGLPEPLIGYKSTLGNLAVWVFFAISGYLITKSCLASATLRLFTIKRLLRIMPALIVLLVASVFVAGPLLTQFTMGEYFADIHTWTYLFQNPAFGNQGYVPGVFDNLPLAGDFNGSLWTIKYELLMYVLLGAMIPVRREFSVYMCVALTITFFTLTLWHELELTNLNVLFWRLEGGTTLRMERVCLLGGFFFSSSLLAFWWPKRGAGLLATVSMLIILACRETALFRPFSALLLPLIVIYVAQKWAFFLRALIPRHDLSYGIYLYAFPVQQATASMGFVGPHYWLITLIVSILATVGLVYLSWILIERPALSLKRRFV